MAGRPKKAVKRSETLVVRLTPKEVKMAQELAGRKGKTVSEWIREQIHNPPMEEAAQLWRLAQAQELIDRHEEGRLAELPVDAEGKVIPSAKAISKVQNYYIRDKVRAAFLAAPGTHPPALYIPAKDGPRTVSLQEIVIPKVEPTIINIRRADRTKKEPKGTMKRKSRKEKP